MPLDTSISNVGEYFSSHYLDSTFAKDVKAQTDVWKEQGSQAVPRRLQALGPQYFRAKTQALEEDQPEKRVSSGGEVAGWHAQILAALGYADLNRLDIAVEGNTVHVPCLGRVNRYNQPWLVVCETHFCLPDGSLKDGMPSEDPLEMDPTKSQLADATEHKLVEGNWSRAIARGFTEEDAPRWMLFLAGSQLILLDRDTYAQGRYLSFDLDDAFGRKEKSTFDHIAAFLSAETLCPGGESDEVLLDKLEEQSHKFAHGVTESLQFAVREAIEMLVNEWALDRTERRKLPLTRLRADEIAGPDTAVLRLLPIREDGSYEITPEHLRHEALAFVYRLLFCFYAEARGGEMGILPIDDDVYRLGYSLESARDLEQVPLTEATAQGSYFHEHLKRLFQIIHAGFHPEEAKTEKEQLTFGQKEEARTFTVRPLTATLFAPDSTPLLNRAQLSNHCLQAVIRRLSLSPDERTRTVGRVNYAELGIIQLGAVYEGLLSYNGMFADQDFIHVKPATGDFRDKKTPTWFVPKDRIEEFTSEEVERVKDGRPRIYTKGTFILHLNGIDREQSASFYTPEVLTRCVVEEALRELLKDFKPEDADRILLLKICEPAMGSGAFLNESSQQLAHRYLELKQKQIGRTIEPSNYADELRRVKHFITTRNVYGVDLNATAVELGALSLWLGSIHRLTVQKGENGGRDVTKPGATPWFGLRLRCGNSLIGARRAVWSKEQLQRGEHAWTSKLLQQVQSDLEHLREQTTPANLAEFRKHSFDLVTKIKWDEFAADARECRDQVVRFCECGRERSTAALSEDEKKLYEKCRATWKQVFSQKDQDELLALYDLLPNGRIRQVERVSFEIFLRTNEQHHDYKAGLPRLLKPRESRAAGEIYHFLIFDPDMVPTRSDKVIKSFWEDDCDKASDWVKKQVCPKWGKQPLQEALEVSDLIDQHWATYARQRIAALDATACTATLWPVPPDSLEALAAGPSLADQERICNELESTSGSFQRLQLVMDTWCALWFWPPSEAGQLPSRDAFLTSSKLLLGRTAPTTKTEIELTSAALGFKIDVLLQAAPGGEVPDTALLAGAVPWFGVADTIRGEQNFHHWELVFVEVLGEKALSTGFDLIVGNPPWLPVAWSASAMFSEIEPLLGVREAKSAEIEAQKDELLRNATNRKLYVPRFTELEAAGAFLNSPRLFRPLVGMKANLYKNFIVSCLAASSSNGIVGLLHPEGPYNDNEGGLMRRMLYPRLRAHFQFRNQLQSLLFADIPHREEYSINVYGQPRSGVEFQHMSNLFTPKTIEASRTRSVGDGLVPGIKDDEDNWNTAPHRDRLILIRDADLALFARFFEEGHVKHFEAKLPQVHARQIMDVIHRLAGMTQRLGDFAKDYFPTQIWNEVTSQQDGAITRQASPAYEPAACSDWIVSGPHFFIGTPFNKTPRTNCTSKGAYDEIDLTRLEDAYLPRATYRPGDKDGDRSRFNALTPNWPSSEPVTTRYRYANREMISKGAERELVTTILPPGSTQINTVFSLVFKDVKQLVQFAAPTLSICFDFLVKLVGKGHCNVEQVSSFPWVGGPLVIPLSNRMLRLVCLTSAYAELWKSAGENCITEDSWTSDDKRLSNCQTEAMLRQELNWPELKPSEWSWKTPLRSDFARRQALLEIDVLVAQALGLSLDELLTIYRVQFPVKRMYELADEYDARGRRLPNTVRKSQGGTEFRSAREEALQRHPGAYKSHPAADALSAEWPFKDEIGDVSPLEVNWEINDGLQTVSKHFYPPFCRADLEADYAHAWEVFEKRYRKNT